MKSILPKNKIDIRKIELEMYREFDNQIERLEKELSYIKLYLRKIIKIRKNIRNSKLYLIQFIFNAKFIVIYQYLRNSKRAIFDFWKIKKIMRIAREGLEEVNEGSLTKIFKKFNETQS